MRYISTRGGDERLSFEEAVLTGLSPNGGLYIPEHIPSLPTDWHTAWAGLSFPELACAVLALYIAEDELPRADLRALVAASYRSFRHPDITPLRPLAPDAHGPGRKTFVLELFHGPTYAFKDVALQLLGNLFEYFLQRRNARRAPGEPVHKLTVLGATSGDTGSAAIYGLRNKANISIFILHPKGRISPIQEAQMTTVTDKNVHNIAVKGTFDDCQDIVKTLFADTPFNAKHRLGAINSINWARILAQTVYYFLSYFHLMRTAGSAAPLTVQYVVPTGNFGDVLAGYYAKRMGLPMAPLVIATNANDILWRFWQSGVYARGGAAGPDSTGDEQASSGGSTTAQPAGAGGAVATLSPAMDILVASNFERLLWYLVLETSGGTDAPGAGATLARWMGAMKRDGRVSVPVDVLALARRDFVAERISDAQTLEAIKRHYLAEPSYIADPHTAVGLAAARLVAPTNARDTVQVVLATAHAAKFSEAVTQALDGCAGFDMRAVLPAEFVGLLGLPRRVRDVERPDVGLVKEAIEECVSGG